MKLLLGMVGDNTPARLSLSASPLFSVPQETLETMKWKAQCKAGGEEFKVLSCYSFSTGYTLSNEMLMISFIFVGNSFCFFFWTWNEQRI